MFIKMKKEVVCSFATIHIGDIFLALNNSIYDIKLDLTPLYVQDGRFNNERTLDLYDQEYDVISLSDILKEIENEI